MFKSTISRLVAAACLAATVAVPFASAEACHRRGGYGPAVHYPRPVYATPAYQPAVYPMVTTNSAQPTMAALVAHAKQMLKSRDYDAAQKGVTAALAREPKNSALMQLKSLISFAQSDYQTSAAMAYSALTLGRSLDWNAIQQLYPSANEYTLQYRLLSATAKDKPDQPHLQFLLAYHHLMLGHKDAGRTALLAAQEKLPQDKLIPLLLSQLPAETKAVATPVPETLAADEPAPPVK